MTYYVSFRLIIQTPAIGILHSHAGHSLNPPVRHTGQWASPAVSPVSQPSLVHDRLKLGLSRARPPVTDSSARPTLSAPREARRWARLPMGPATQSVSIHQRPQTTKSFTRLPAGGAPGTATESAASSAAPCRSLPPAPSVRPHRISKKLRRRRRHVRRRRRRRLDSKLAATRDGSSVGRPDVAPLGTRS